MVHIQVDKLRRAWREESLRPHKLNGVVNGGRHDGSLAIHRRI